MSGTKKDKPAGAALLGPKIFRESLGSKLQLLGLTRRGTLPDTMLLRSTIRALDRLTARLGRTPERAPHLISGSRGEEEAYFYLRNLGFTVIARDYRSPRRRGDIDLVAWEGQTLCFVEVKTRSRRNFMPAEAAVDDEKRATLSALAREYLRQYVHVQTKAPAFRFDVVSVYLENDGSADITLFRDAFLMS